MDNVGSADVGPVGLWMQDKMLNQQRLARDLASLVEVLREGVVGPFLDAFWKTMAREWNGIGALRLVQFLHSWSTFAETNIWKL